jgi:hypothetical protein
MVSCQANPQPAPAISMQYQQDGIPIIVLDDESVLIEDQHV